MKILFCHLLNNFTGAPKVLATELKLLSNDVDYDISLLTSKTDGILSNLDNIKIYDNGYRWSNNRFKLIISFIFAQLKSFFFVLFHRYDLIYINTVLPFGAALAAKIRGEKIIYHVHEVYINPGIFKKLYYKIMKISAYKIICVSNYVNEIIANYFAQTSIIYNPIETNEIKENIDYYLQKKFESRIIFMPTSLKEYKGIKQFVELARLNEDFNFWLLCSVSLTEIENYFSSYDLPKNLLLIGKQNNLLEYYRKSSVTINLSLQDKFIETFGLTIAEGFDSMSPAIAPAFGGPLEIIEDEKNGFLVNPYDLNQISSALNKLFTNLDTYKTFANNAKLSLKKFDVNSFKNAIIREINN